MAQYPQKEMYRNFGALAEAVVSCNRCPRLREYAKDVVEHKPRRFSGYDFWGKPVPGFGDADGKLMIIGLAPARTGALRTGRIFTGDASSRFLVRALCEAGFTNQPESESRDDGLQYRDSYITAAVKCAPPGDRPLPEEIANCSAYLTAELTLLKNLKAVLVLGALAFRSYLDYLEKQGTHARGVKFEHGRAYRFREQPTLYASYHPSPRNTNTGKLTHGMLVSVLRRIKRDLG